jgi:hypothetical protein
MIATDRRPDWRGSNRGTHSPMYIGLGTLLIIIIILILVL